MSPEPTGVHGLLKQRKLFTHKHIMNLRKKLGVDYIETVRGVGYKIAKENQ